MSTQVDPNAELKKLIQGEISKSGITERKLASQHTTAFTKRGYHMFRVPKGAAGLKAFIYGGGGGSGGAGSGGVGVGKAGGGGSGASGAGDGEYWETTRHGVHIFDLQSYQPLEDENGVPQYYRHIGVYVGRGGKGGIGGKGVGGCGCTAANGMNGTVGTAGRPSFIFGIPHLKDKALSHADVVTVAQVEAYAPGDHSIDFLTIASAPGCTVPFAYAHGGNIGGAGNFGYGYLAGDPVFNGNGGNGVFGVPGYAVISSGPGGGGGSQAGTGGNAGLVYTINTYGNTAGFTATNSQAGNVAGTGLGGDGGNSNVHKLDHATRITGWGGFGHDDETTGADFEGDPDPEPLADSSSEIDGVEYGDDPLGFSLGGGGGAGAGRTHEMNRNGGNVVFPKNFDCECGTVTKPGEPKPPHHPKGYGTGAAGGAGGNGIFVQQSESSLKSGPGANGVRGADGAVLISIVDINGEHMPIDLEKVEFLQD